MRLLHVVPTYFPAIRYGGPIRSVHGLCTALAARGHDVHVFTTNVDGAGNSAVPLDRPVDMDGVMVRYFASPRVRRLYRSPDMARALQREIGSFDLAHLHSVFLWPTWAAARIARKAGKPYVLSPRGMLVKELVRARSRYAKTAWIALIERANLENAAAVHVTSAVEAADLREFGYLLRGRIIELPNGVTFATDHPEERESEPPYLLVLGRLSWKKRIEIAIDVLPLVEGIRLVVAGGDDEKLAASLRNRAKAIGVLSRVDFVGPVDDERKRKLLRGALALLMPSMSENFGNSALEAMAEGVPAIVVARVGVAGVVAESGGGFVVGATATEFADAIRQLQRNPELRTRMGERARATVAAGFAWTAIGARMESEYLSIVDLHRRG